MANPIARQARSRIKIPRRFQLIGHRVCELRKQKKLTRVDIEQRVGVSRSCVSRIENGETVPGIETLEKLARVLAAPLYQFFYKGDLPPNLSNSSNRKSRKTGGDVLWGSKGKDRELLQQFCHLFGRMTEVDRKRLFFIAQKLAPSELRSSSPEWREWLMISRSAERTS
jgi:transcriptional regulator with XRE-family HTH domain